MQFLKALFVALFTIAAVVAGAVAAAFVGAVGLMVLWVRRLIGGPSVPPAPRPGPVRPYRQPKAGDADVIEVSATEVHR